MPGADARLVILKMWILTICSAGVFSIALLCIYQGKITEGLSLIGGGGLTATGSAIFKTLKGCQFLKGAGFWLHKSYTSRYL